MTNISLNKYGPIISSKSIGKEIYELIDSKLSSMEIVKIELTDIKSMATFCAKQIFGRLYLKLGSEKFFERIQITGADDDIKTIIMIGIQNALEETNTDNNI
jgi:hypothetical protein